MARGDDTRDRTWPQPPRCGQRLARPELAAILTAAAVLAGATIGRIGRARRSTRAPGADRMPVMPLATLAVVPSVPVAGLALVLGIDRFVSEAPALINFIGGLTASTLRLQTEAIPHGFFNASRQSSCRAPIG